MTKYLLSFAFALSLLMVPLISNHAHAASAMSDNPSNVMKAPYDVQFLNGIIQHHEDGIKMMEMAEQKAQSPKVKSIAQKMSDDQQKEISELKDMRDQIQPNAPEKVDMHMLGMKPMNMEKLENAYGKTFDKEFLKMMIMHHQDAVKMTSDALRRAKTEDVKMKAKDMQEKQKNEISQMRSMFKEI